ncbi:nuclear transport factor 2 family protein [Agromyces laixinhei]|uniref:nuclear transport factor 2 family protein n=1 Tax=Agromyces laixinhei TaxID=2585717 RepID=UPI001116913A|nr:nuclear transport factor 2 family protein [Agromyces laixinhei]
MDSIDAWKQAGAARDFDAAVAVVAPHGELVSPLTDQLRFRGPGEIGQLLEAVFEVVSDYLYERDLRGDGEAFLTSRAWVGGVEIHEFQHLELDGDGASARITLAVRPLPALTALNRDLGRALARRQGHPARARRLARAGALLDAVARTGDRKYVPLAAPCSSR